jgi:YggT family protein
MGEESIWWSYWYFHLPNYILSVVFYSLLGRFALGFFVRPDSQNYIFRWFRLLTDWVIRPVLFITPQALHGILIPPIAAFWIVIARIAFFAAMFSAGLTPRIGPPG